MNLSVVSLKILLHNSIIILVFFTYMRKESAVLKGKTWIIVSDTKNRCSRHMQHALKGVRNEHRF